MLNTSCCGVVEGVVLEQSSVQENIEVNTVIFEIGCALSSDGRGPFGLVDCFFHIGS